MRQKTRSLIWLLPVSALMLLLSGCVTPMAEDALPATCNEKPESGMCRAAFTRYYYDADRGECRSFIWGGCGGNVPFDTMESCQSACRAPGSADAPAAPVKQGLSF
ncbi:MAG: alpha-1-antitrypsin [Alcanivorax sp.]|nr:alpha-1-antitrypsin [Alcanivorax sp.]